MPEANGLLMAFMEPPAEMGDEFNDWYDMEHLPERVAIPGFLSGTRWVCLHGYPRWVATYFLTKPAVLHEPAYEKVGGNNASPWTKRVTARTIGRLRVVGERIGVGETPITAETTARLLVARYPVASGAAETALVRAIEDVAAGLAERPAVRLFRGIEAPAGEPGSGVWLLAGFARPVGAETMMPALGLVGGVGATHFNLYMPHWKTLG